MARPPRKNADYFPFYAKDGRTLFLLESKYRCMGTGFFTNLMRFLTLETDHHVNIQDETDAMYFFSKCHCDEDVGTDMLNILAKTSKIDRELWQIKVIASQDLLDSVTDAYRNRINDIITMAKIKEKYISDAGNGVSDAGNPQAPVVSNGEKPQSKVKKSKVKKRKLNKRNNNDFINPYLGEFQNVKLTKKELSKLEIKFTDAIERIETLSVYIQSVGDKYKDHYATILNWERMADKKRGDKKIKPTTYAQKQDAERRGRAAWLLKEMEDEKNSEGTDKAITLLPGNEI